MNASSHTCITSVGTYLPGTVQLTNIDVYPASDANNPSIASLQQCQSTCASTPACVAFNIQCKDNVLCGGPQSAATYKCSLKTSLSAGSITVNGAVTAFILTQIPEGPYFAPISGVDFPGNNLLPLGMLGTYDQCAAACLSTTNCGMFTISSNLSITSSSNQTCWLKTITNTGWGYYNGYQSYVLPKSTISGIALMDRCAPCPAGTFKT